MRELTKRSGPRAVLRFFLVLPVTATALLLAASVHAEPLPRPMTAVDMIELPGLSSPSLSPDGKHLIYLRTDTDWQENKRIRRYRLLDLETGKALPPPEPESADESFDDVQWRPDGSGFITLLEREGDEFDQIYFYSLESRSFSRLTDHGSSISSAYWTPDGNALVFVAPRQDDAETRRLLDDDWLLRPYDSARNREIWR
ncbi:MAG: hypothetical protein AAGE85_16805, partial [Pseudomonadota bacterium]